MITTYYRLHANVAEDLVKVLPYLVQPDSWASALKPEAKGTVTLVASPPDLFSNDGQLSRDAAVGSEQTRWLVVARAVLIVHQTRAVHEQIADFIQRVEAGDATQGSGFGGGGGGFGGGFMSVPDFPTRAK